MRVIIVTEKNADTVKAVQAYLGTQGISGGALGLDSGRCAAIVLARGSKRYDWYLEARDITALDGDVVVNANTTPFSKVVEAIKNVLAPAAPAFKTMPFLIHGHNVNVHPGNRVVVGCATIDKYQFEQLRGAMRPSAVRMGWAIDGSTPYVYPGDKIEIHGTSVTKAQFDEIARAFDGK